MVSAASLDALIFQINLEMKNFVNEGSGIYWKESMDNPRKYSRWVLIQNGGRDSLLRHLNFEALEKQFTLQKELRGNSKWSYRIYKVKDS